MQKIFNNKIFIIFQACLAALLIGSCGHSNEWTVTGTIEGAEGEVMVLEASSNGNWYALDSVKLDASGYFSLAQPAAGYPDIYRLRLGNKTLYFPIDSIETVTVASRADAFDTEYTLEGSPTAEKLLQVDRRVREAAVRSGVNAISTDSMLKRELGMMVLDDGAGIISYYIVNKRIGGVPIFDPANKNDLRIIGAVANAYTEFRPNDPRTSYLKNLYLNSRREGSVALSDTIHAPEVRLFDINLYDHRGRQHSLQSLADQGKVVVLNFIVYDNEAAPDFNRILHQAYEQYHGAGLEIYQVSIDEDEYFWKQASANLPWIAVYNPTSTSSRNLLNYNVTTIPTTFIIDRNGMVAERVTDVTQLNERLAKYF